MERTIVNDSNQQDNHQDPIKKFSDILVSLQKSHNHFAEKLVPKVRSLKGGRI